MADSKKQIRQGQVVQTGPTKVDQAFAVPSDIKDVSLKDSNKYKVPDLSGEADVDVTIQNPPGLPHLYPPTWMTVVDQTIRWTADGVAVVDVTIEFEDVPGASGYDVRVNLHDPKDDYVLGI